MRRLPPSVSAVAGFAAVLAAAASIAAASAPSPWVSAPAGTAGRASELAAAALAGIRLPAGAQRLAGPRRAARELFGAGLARSGTRASSASAATGRCRAPPRRRVPRADARRRGRSLTWSNTDRPNGRGVSWSRCRSDERWIGPRLLVGRRDRRSSGRVALARSCATAVVVWTPRRLELPAGVASVSVRALGGGAQLASVTDAKTVARIVAAVDGLDVDDAVHAIYPCPEQPAGRSRGSS